MFATSLLSRPYNISWVSPRAPNRVRSQLAIHPLGILPKVLQPFSHTAAPISRLLVGMGKLDENNTL